MSRILIPLVLCFAAAGGLVASPAVAQKSASECAPYFEAVASGNIKLPAVVPDRLLSDADTAIFCLVAGVKKMSSEVGPRGLPPETAQRLLSATAAIRVLMTRATSADQGRANPAALDEFIAKFRAADDIDVVSVLSYGARSDLYDLRLNSVLILGNIIDNTTVCAPLAHLNDPGLLDSPNGINGRANLLGVISVVAPWAYKENFDNITRTTQAIKSSIQESDPNVKSTSASLANIAARLLSQTTTSNRNVLLPEAWRRDCAAYVENFKPKIIAIANVQY
jgi:hypothetical protein